MPTAALRPEFLPTAGLQREPIPLTLARPWQEEDRLVAMEMNGNLETLMSRGVIQQKCHQSGGGMMWQP
jgi:hypothetical protein